MQPVSLKTVLVVMMVHTIGFAGTKKVIDQQASGSNGTVEVKANVAKRVSLSVADTGANDLVSATGIDFGDVDADGTGGKVPGIAQGEKAQYVADFIFSATRTGTGNVTLTAERSVAGTFHSGDGIVIEDSNGALQNLAGTGGAVNVLTAKPEGDYTKKLGITVHSTDNGALSTTLRFTLSAL